MENHEVDRLIDALIDREGGYVDHPADKGGPTCFGITEAVARAQGYGGPMRRLPRAEAAAVYHRLYWVRPRFDEIAKRSPRLAAELFDTGVNMGPAVAATFLQRALTALNRNGQDFADLVPDGRIGAVTLSALDAFLAKRGNAGGETAPFIGKDLRPDLRRGALMGEEDYSGAQADMAQGSGQAKRHYDKSSEH